MTAEGLNDPVPIFTALTNDDAHELRRALENEGIVAFATDDNSLVGHWTFGTIPHIHKPQVWVDRADGERAAAVIVEFEKRREARDPGKATDTPETVDGHCESCGSTSKFPESLNGTVQDCPECFAAVDVGEPEDWDGEWMEASE